MVNIPQPIYFDESGFTGNNLLNPNQTFFSYASIAIDPDDAKKFVLDLIKKHSLNGEELKGCALIKHSKGRKAILELLNEFKGKIKVSVSNKKYALAAKFFEYIFEPCISEKNSLFYSINFHKFISNMLYLEFCSMGAGAEEIFVDFEKLMRKGNFEELKHLFSTTINPNMSPMLVQICEFAYLQRDKVSEELQSLRGTGSEKWILDLTATCLNRMLAEWGQEFEQMTAYCDHSKPLEHLGYFFEAMINRNDKLFVEFFGDRQPITFNLSENIHLVNSVSVPAIQLADVIAAAFSYAFIERPNDNFACKIREFFPLMLSKCCILPEKDQINIEDPTVIRNALVLIELHSRSTKGLPLLDGFREYINQISLIDLENISIK